MNLFIKEGFLWLLRAVMGTCIFGFLQKAAYPLPKRGHVQCGEGMPGWAFPVKCADGTVKCASRTAKCPGGTAECPGGTVKCPGGTAKCPDGTVKCAGGTAKCAGGTAKCPDGTVKCPDGTAKCASRTAECPDGTAKCAGGMAKCAGGTAKCAGGTAKCPGGMVKYPGGTMKCADGTVKCASRTAKYPGGTAKCAGGTVKYAGGIGFVCCGLRFGTGANGLLSLPGLLAFCYLCILLLVSLSDLETRRIDDRLQAGIVLIGLVSLWLDLGHTLPERCIGVFAVSLPMLILSVAASGAFGGGDIKLMASSGFLLGGRGIVAALFLGLLTGGCYALIQLLRKKVGRKDRIAFGPFLALGLAIALFWGDQVADRYLFPSVILT